MNSIRTRKALTLIACFGFLLCVPAQGDTITDAALGSQLAGGWVTVTRFGGALSSAPFVVDSVTGAISSAPGSFTLTVGPGDTSTATWTLTNTDPSPIFLNVITAVTIDLTLSSISLFDSGSLPSTPASGGGLLGVTYLSGIAISSSGEVLPWSDAANTGDMYRAVNITFSGGLASGSSSAWQDDTDIITPVPEPAHTLVIAGLLLNWARGRRRRSKAGVQPLV